MKEQIFKNGEFGSVRMVMINDTPYFVGKDVAEILGYTNPSKALADHVDDEDKLNNESLLSFELNLGQRGGWLINESGLYSLIIGSKLPKVRQFKRWITSEVLPTIRKSGKYEIINSEVILCDPRLTAPSKTIFMYLCSCAGGKKEFITDRSRVLREMNMGVDMYTNHLKKLKKLGYIASEPYRLPNGKIAGIKFTLNYNMIPKALPEEVIKIEE